MLTRTAAPALLAAVLLMAGCGSGEPGVSAPPPPASPAMTATASDAPTAVPSSSAAVRAVYWLGAAEDPRGPRLYREFGQRPTVDDPVRDALELMLAGQPFDPDYTSLWAEGTTVLGVTRDGDTAGVDLSRQATTNGGGSAMEAMSLQQLVHTVTAADPSLTGVRLTVEGEPVETLWGATDTRQAVRRAPAAEVLGPVWIDLEEGATLAEQRFGGTATVFEATVSWQLRQGDTVVVEGFSTATTGAPERGAWEATANAPPGDYALWAFESSAKDGSITWLDTKAVTLS